MQDNLLSKVSINNKVHLAPRYAWYFSVRGLYLFWDANFFPRAKLEENCELRGTDNLQRQTPNLLYRLYLFTCMCKIIKHVIGFPYILCLITNNNLLITSMFLEEKIIHILRWSVGDSYWMTKAFTNCTLLNSYFISCMENWDDVFCCLAGHAPTSNSTLATAAATKRVSESKKNSLTRLVASAVAVHCKVHCKTIMAFRCWVERYYAYRVLEFRG